MFDKIREFESIPDNIRKIAAEMRENPEAFENGEEVQLFITSDLFLSFYFDKKGALQVRIYNEGHESAATVDDTITIIREIYLLTRGGLEDLIDDVIDYGLKREFPVSDTIKLTIIPHGREAEILFEGV